MTWHPLHKRGLQRTSPARGGRDRNVVVSSSFRPKPHALVASGVAVALVASGLACVPPGNSTPSDAGPVTSNPAVAAPTSTFKVSENIMKTAFFDDFNRTPTAASAVSIVPPPRPMASASATATPSAAASASASPSASATASVPASATASAMPAAPPGSDLGPDWVQAGTNSWRIENGRLCGQGAKNHGVWLNRVLPVNARIEFDAIADSPDGDLKAEVWGDGRSAATSISYTNATSYLVIFGGWQNKFHVLARINEHGDDRKKIEVDPASDDPKRRPVAAGQVYRFKVERTDGKTVRWFVDDVEMHSFVDAQPLAGAGHDHFGFNNWQVKVCFDNVRVTPL